MDLIVSPTTVALNPQQSAAVPVLKVGDIIEAKVLELLGQSIAQARDRQVDHRGADAGRRSRRARPCGSP